MSFSSAEFWEIVKDPESRDRDIRINEAVNDPFLIAAAAGYNRLDQVGRQEGVIYFADTLAETMENVGLGGDPEAAALAWERCREQHQGC